MKKLFFSISILLCGLTLTARGGPWDAQWRKVEEAKRHGLPRTAITNLEPILQEAIKAKAYAEATKALGEKITLEGQIEGNKPEEKITRLESEIGKAPKEMAPILEALLADWYWEYYRENNWRFMQRTAVQPEGGAPGKDFTTWDLPRLFAEIDRHFQKALSAEAVLKATPVGLWDDLLQKGTLPDSYRPTLYDFIAHEALAFYSSGEQAAARPEDAFDLMAGSPALDSADKFIAWQPGTEGQAGGQMVFRALRVYQDLLHFHEKDPVPRVAFADADLERLSWAWNTAVGDDKNARYKAALESFIGRFAEWEISAMALEREARVWQQEGDLVKAHTLAARGAETFPKSLGGKMCRNLVTELESRSSSIVTERFWNCFEGKEAPDSSTAPAAGSNACPLITVHYRNVTAAYFRAIPYNWETFLGKRHNRPEGLDEREQRQILESKPALEWSRMLPPTTNYADATFEVPAPTTLKPGFYFIAASHEPGFGQKENTVSLVPVWVTDLALITREHEGTLEGFVLQADSGDPIEGAEISVWHLDNYGNRRRDPVLKTDENGLFSMKADQNVNYLVRARHNGREAATTGETWFYSRTSEPEKPDAMTFFFTDRAIYRPGQTIQYKGICLWVDHEKDKYEVLKGEELTVVFRDANGKEIARQRQRANDYGSFAGSFTAPRDRLMGQMSLVADGRAHGQSSFNVEEYKRPKFEVTLDAPKSGVRLNDKVTLTGHAMGYTGAAVDGARVAYRVTRQVRMPWWWGWWGRPMGGENQEIVHSTARTETDGTFKIVFTARPDAKVPEKDEPTFEFSVNADVTDSAGETRSAEHSIRVGYTALEATMKADDWQTEGKAVDLTVEAKTLDGEPQVTEGSVKIYALQAPARVQRPPLLQVGFWAWQGRFPQPINQEEQSTNDMSNPNNWPLGKVLAEQGFTTDTNGVARLSFRLGAGAYRAVLETQDRYGKKVTGKLPLQVLKPDDSHLAIKVPNLVAAPEWEVQPGQEFTALWGTGYESGRAFIEIEHRHKLIRRFWTRAGQTQQQIELPVTEDMRGGFTLHVTQVRENRAFLESRPVSVPWKNKELTLKWTHFVSKLQPGQKETWGIEIKGPTNGTTEKAAAEMAATLYDESLDAFTPHNWPSGFEVFREDSSSLQARFENMAVGFQHVWGEWVQHWEQIQISYRSFPPEWQVPSSFGFGIVNALGGTELAHYSKSFGLGRAEREAVTTLAAAAAPPAPATPPGLGADKSVEGLQELTANLKHAPALQPSARPDLNQVTARKNLNETAFFYPQLTSDSNGLVQMTFTMPEALTKWRFMAFAHDASAHSGYLEAHAVTSKDLMVQPNPPRFLREGDEIEFTVKVSNQSETNQAGTVRLTFNLASDGERADKLLGVRPVKVGQASSRSTPTQSSETGKMPVPPEQEFNIPAKESRSYSWRISVPDGCGYLTYKAVGASATVSDGEEGAVPVLARRILVTESLPLPIRGPGTKKFEFERLLKSGGSKTLRNEGLTVQMVSHPAWYAVLALPYLMEFPHECSEQTFNRFYANALARNIANSDPKIRRIFDQWKNLPALNSPLEKNQELKAVMIEETPWLRDAENESQARRNVGILFDENRLNYETDAALSKLSEMQLPDGSWPWFPGGRGNDYITLYITTGFGRLRHLGVDVNVRRAVRSLQRLDQSMTEEYAEIKKLDHPEEYVPSSTDALYLYGRSFFLKDQAIGSEHKQVVQFFLGQARKYWLQTGCRQTQAHLALALKRFATSNGSSDPTPEAIMASLKERSVENEEMGRFWRDTEESWWWYRAPIETQALMIEAFDEVSGDAATVEECRVWLLKQKQTQDWRTTKATADAVYALLLRGKELLSSDALVEVKLDGVDVTAFAVGQASSLSSLLRASGTGRMPVLQNGQNSAFEPGTGFYEYRFAPADIKPRLGDITVRKTDPGVAWGSVHWQYLEDMSKVTPYAGTPLKLAKKLFVKVNTGKGQALEPVKGPLKVGDELVVRMELRSDRDMEFVHLKDQRGSGTEPVNVLSGYRSQDGLAYYESTRDTASHFFIDYLPKGTYVFEYSTRVQLRGQYQTGIAQIQCMYAPEFNSHSESVMLEVK